MTVRGQAGATRCANGGMNKPDKHTDTLCWAQFYGETQRGAEPIANFIMQKEQLFQSIQPIEAPEVALATITELMRDELQPFLQPLITTSLEEYVQATVTKTSLHQLLGPGPGVAQPPTPTNQPSSQGAVGDQHRGRPGY
ncbi:hypothetical protein PR048_011296 [Dryococelus australis]|uniref:Uncharacterized protein n=1 Tax=Dryococelus australis TaxID=614101 RepID=A0ABQ9HLQ7_9NEOP|nr:hypothetical protein PR048_011296 [Dryococelus australis]